MTKYWLMFLCNSQISCAFAFVFLLMSSDDGGISFFHFQCLGEWKIDEEYLLKWQKEHNLIMEYNHVRFTCMKFSMFLWKHLVLLKADTCGFPNHSFNIDFTLFRHLTPWVVKITLRKTTLINVQDIAGSHVCMCKRLSNGNETEKKY